MGSDSPAFATLLMCTSPHCTAAAGPTRRLCCIMRFLREFLHFTVRLLCTAREGGLQCRAPGNAGNIELSCCMPEMTSSVPSRPPTVTGPPPDRKVPSTEHDSVPMLMGAPPATEMRLKSGPFLRALCFAGSGARQHADAGGGAACGKNQNQHQAECGSRACIGSCCRMLRCSHYTTQTNYKQEWYPRTPSLWLLEVERNQNRCSAPVFMCASSA